jgi:hypothetical protein
VNGGKRTTIHQSPVNGVPISGQDADCARGNFAARPEIAR